MNQILVISILLASIITSQYFSITYAQVPSSGVSSECEVESCRPVDIRYDVELVPQKSGYSCWAAGAAMLVGWRDNISIDPSEIANAIGYWKQYEEGLAPNDENMFRHWGLTWEFPMNYSVEGFADLLRNNGPLWVASAEPGPHIRVVTGMVGDGTVNGTIVYINDPWERGMTEFRMPNLGSQYTETYFEFVQKQDELAYGEIDIPGAIYVAYMKYPGVFN